MGSTRRAFTMGMLALPFSSATANLPTDTLRPATARAAAGSRLAASVVVAASDSRNPDRADLICDGIADQQEINTALSSLSGAGTVCLLDGTFHLSAPVTVDRSFLRLEGQGWGTVLRVTDGVNRPAVIVGAAGNCQHVELAQLRVDGNAARQAGGHGILLRGSGHRLARVNVVNAHDDGIRLESADGSNQFEYVFDDVTIAQPGRDGLSIDNTIYNSEFIRVVVNGTKGAGGRGRHGIYDRGVQNKFLLCHPYFNPGNGFHKDTGREVIIHGGEYETNGGYGVRLSMADGCLVSGVLCYGNGKEDICTWSCADCAVVDNTTRSTQAAGIYLSTSSHNLVRGNRVVGTGWSGIRLGEGATLNRVEGNQIHGISTGPSSIYINDSHDNDITANVVEINILEAGSSAGNRVTGNRVTAGRVVLVGPGSESSGNRTLDG